MANWVEERLYQALGSNSCVFLFPNVIVHNENTVNSYHSTFILDVKRGTKQIVRWLQFKNSWIREAGCRDLIKRCWSQSARVDIQKRIRMCGISLAKWGMGLKAQFRPQVTVCKRHINELKARSDNSSVRELEEACHELNEILAQQEKIWQQRAKRFRLNEGDSNTHYFHKAVIA
eukprot:XP_015582402.1 uncharacterized protein LOC8273547 [Ricinus communis]